MITNCMANAARCAMLEAIKDDKFKIALYGPSANLGPKTAQYTAVGEVEGQGYTPGGINLTGAMVGEAGGVAYLDFDDPTWPNVTVAAAGALIYNVTRNRAAFSVLAFDKVYTSRLGPMTVELPPPGQNALIRIGTN
jgi:hypothetical protein